MLFQLIFETIVEVHQIYTIYKLTKNNMKDKIEPILK
jgi:hypothetical protein